MHNKIFTLIIILTVTSIVFMIHDYGSAFACSCVTRTLTEEFNGSSAVFAGEVVDIANTSSGHDPSGHGYKVTFEVDRSWKGISGERASVYTGMGGGDCGYSFKIGEKYLVYTYNPAEIQATGICNRTQILAEADEDLAALGDEWNIYKVKLDDQTFKIPYRTIDNNLQAIEVDPNFDSLILTIVSDPDKDGAVEIVIPRNLSDPGYSEDEDFIVLADGQETEIEEVKKSPCFRALVIDVPTGSEQIEIIGTSLTIPGQPKPTVPPVYIATDKNNYSGRENVSISGCTNLALDDSQISVELLNPEGQTYLQSPVYPNRDGSFAASFFVGGEQIINGTYTATATYAGETTTSTFVVPEFPVNLMIIVAVGLTGAVVVLRLGSRILRQDKT